MTDQQTPYGELSPRAERRMRLVVGLLYLLLATGFAVDGLVTQRGNAWLFGVGFLVLGIAHVAIWYRRRRSRER